MRNSIGDSLVLCAAEIRKLAAEVNLIGPFDVVIHNAGLYQVPEDSIGAEGLSLLLTVNSLAPYLLTNLINRPEYLILLSSGMHLQGRVDLDAISANKVSYSDTKLHDLILAKYFARIWPQTYSNAIDPRWVPTKICGASAPDSLEKGFETQVWLAESNEPGSLVSGKYFHHKKQTDYLKIADDVNVQDELVDRFKSLLQ
ncbi:Rossmann-fold NAD(P)-binding domain-containing protein [Mucilaginibacter ginkgonis]|uniref:Uncharacterized protein n=1 Tax=Mucilaginibacter ginkgonis TaxID=2682091 RepID=A0A6I4HWM7_9SPHI|nr:daunorubicin C-13 ketoreductase [Mucilaginibacter ginkgonis]QQL51245.1 hypothetical protein GO620_007295 [Mucilaginibacter ginkgonis]